MSSLLFCRFAYVFKLEVLTHFILEQNGDNFTIRISVQCNQLGLYLVRKVREVDHKIGEVVSVCILLIHTMTYAVLYQCAVIYDGLHLYSTFVMH